MAKKRPNGEGRLCKLPSGSWQIQLMDGYNQDGSRKYKSFVAPKLEDVKKMKRE